MSISTTYRRLLPLFYIAFALLFAACGEDEPATEGVGANVECRLNSDCATGAVCEAGACVEAQVCEGDDCPCGGDAVCEEGQRCVAGSCVGVSCLSNSECALGEVCALGSCVVDVDADRDRDGVPDGSAEQPTDNCPERPNPGQDDLDGDGLGDACDDDLDGDAVPNSTDTCPTIPDPEQADRDGDGTGDVCEGDRDNDGVSDDVDNCAGAANPDQDDIDGDGAGDVCDVDIDGDDVANALDLCPNVFDPAQENADQDDRGNACDADFEGVTLSGAVVVEGGSASLFESFTGASVRIGGPESVDVDLEADGTFAVEGLTRAGDYSVDVRWPGWVVPQTRALVDLNTAVVEVGLSAAHESQVGETAVTLSGVATLEDGQGESAGISVAVFRESDDQLVATTTTTNEGAFAVSASRNESYRVRFTVAGYETLTLSGVVWESGQGAFVYDGEGIDVVLLAIALMGQLDLTIALRPTWLLEAGPTARALVIGGGRQELVDGVRDGESISFSGLEAGVYTYRVESPGFGSAIGEVVLSEDAPSASEAVTLELTDLGESGLALSRLAMVRDTDLREAAQRGGLRGADLRNINLVGAEGGAPDLSCLDMRGADLSGAQMEGVRLSGADLTGADLSGARAPGAVFVAPGFDPSFVHSRFLPAPQDGSSPFRVAREPTNQRFPVLNGALYMAGSPAMEPNALWMRERVESLDAFETHLRLRIRRNFRGGFVDGQGATGAALVIQGTAGDDVVCTEAGAEGLGYGCLEEGLAVSLVTDNTSCSMQILVQSLGAGDSSVNDQNGPTLAETCLDTDEAAYDVDALETVRLMVRYEDETLDVYLAPIDAPYDETPALSVAVDIADHVQPGADGAHVGLVAGPPSGGPALERVVEVFTWAFGTPTSGCEDSSTTELVGANLQNIDLQGAILNAHQEHTPDIYQRITPCPGGNDETPAERTGVHLDGVSLVGANLSGAMLGGIDLEGALLHNVLMAGASLHGACLRHSDVLFTDLRWSSLDYASFEESQLGSILIGGDFNEDERYLFSSSATAGRFKDASLSDVSFNAISLLGVSFENAVLADVTFNGASFSPSFDQAIFESSFRGATLHTVDLRNAELVRINMEEVSASQVDLSRATLTSSAFDGAHFERSSLRSAFLSANTVDHAAFIDCDMRGIDMQSEVSMRHALLDRVDLSDASLGRFGRVDLTGSTIRATDLDGARFADVSLLGARFDGRTSEPELEDLGMTHNNICQNGTTPCPTCIYRSDVGPAYACAVPDITGGDPTCPAEYPGAFGMNYTLEGLSSALQCHDDTTLVTVPSNNAFVQIDSFTYPSDGPLPMTWNRRNDACTDGTGELTELWPVVLYNDPFDGPPQTHTYTVEVMWNLRDAESPSTDVDGVLYHVDVFEQGVALDPLSPFWPSCVDAMRHRDVSTLQVTLEAYEAAVFLISPAASNVRGTWHLSTGVRE